MANLKDAQEGVPLKVVSLIRENNPHLSKLLAMGVFPGTTLLKVTSFPTQVIEVGYSRFCMDNELASLVTVENI